MRLAVFLDAENFAPSLFKAAAKEIDKIGTVIRRRAFGNFQLPSMAPWKKVLESWPMTAIQVTPLVQKRNAADLSLAIDAMDVLHQGSVEGFCILSSDSDFSALALRLREGGAVVYGFGETKALPAYTSVFDQFFACDVQPIAKGTTTNQLPMGQPDAVMIVNAILAAGDRGDWLPLSRLGKDLRETIPGFTPKSYGFTKLRDLVQSVPGIEVKALKNGAGTSISIRQRQREV